MSSATYDPQLPAREITPFGDFQLRPSHLRTAPHRMPYVDDREQRRRMDGVAREAGLRIAGMARDVDDARDLLEAVGLLPEHSTALKHGPQLRQGG